MATSRRVGGQELFGVTRRVIGSRHFNVTSHSDGRCLSDRNGARVVALPEWIRATVAAAAFRGCSSRLGLGIPDDMTRASVRVSNFTLKAFLCILEANVLAIGMTTFGDGMSMLKAALDTSE